MSRPMHDGRVKVGARILIILLALGMFGCTADGDPRGAPETTASPATATPTATATATATTPPAPAPTTATPTSDPPHPVSLPALMASDFDGGDLRLGPVLDRNSAYTRYAVTYASGELTISGIMNVPDGDGPFPVLVLAHGYIDPDVYTTGRGLAREQDYLARAGYIVLHTDYRNHAGSDVDPDNDLRLRLGYAEDVINAVLADPQAPADDWLLVHVTREDATMAILRGESLVFFRNHAAEGEAGLADMVHQTAMYYEDRLSGTGFGRVMLAGARSPAEEPGARMAERRTNLMDPRMETLLERVDSKFTLVILSSKRARERSACSASARASSTGKQSPGRRHQLLG